MACAGCAPPAFSNTATPAPSSTASKAEFPDISVALPAVCALRTAAQPHRPVMNRKQRRQQARQSRAVPPGSAGSDAAAALAAALSQHAAGRLDEAMARYRALLAQ